MQKLANDLRLACQRISRRVRFEGTYEVAPHQIGVLGYLLDTPRTPTYLADQECISTPSMTRTINCLEDSGYVQRIPHPDDGRQVLVELTDNGKTVLERTISNRDSWMMSRLSDLSEEELKLLSEAVGVLAKVAAK